MDDDDPFMTNLRSDPKDSYFRPDGFRMEDFLFQTLGAAGAVFFFMFLAPMGLSHTPMSAFPQAVVSIWFIVCGIVAGFVGYWVARRYLKRRPTRFW